LNHQNYLRPTWKPSMKTIIFQVGQANNSGTILNDLPWLN